MQVPDDDIDPVEEQEWLDEQEVTAIRYLQSAGVLQEEIDHLEFEWSVHNCVALWRYEAAPKSHFWVITGDVPTDMLLDRSILKPRNAMLAFCDQWREVSGYLLCGEQHPSIRIGEGLESSKLQELGELLKCRADLLRDWASDKKTWAAGLA
jgi:hypothetical protein